MYISIQHAYTRYKNSICIITSGSYREASHSRRVEGANSTLALTSGREILIHQTRRAVVKDGFLF